MPVKNIDSNSRNLGRAYEQMALKYLQAQGLYLLQENYSCPMGEIDLIMTDAEYLVFVEVRYRKARGYASAIETITAAKQRKLLRTAQSFLLHNPRYRHKPCRFDVIGLDMENDGNLELNWIKNAFME